MQYDCETESSYRELPLVLSRIQIWPIRSGFNFTEIQDPNMDLSPSSIYFCNLPTKKLMFVYNCSKYRAPFYSKLPKLALKYP
jgi:hypothetical protein